MVRIIKRYESRKLYDTEESRYVSLEEVGAFVRHGQEVRVVDNASGEDVTGQTLTQVILDEGRSGRSPISSDLLHDLLRKGEKALSTGVEQARQGVDRLIEAGLERVTPLRQAREEMEVLRSRLEKLEGSLAELETEPPPASRNAKRKRPAVKPAKQSKRTIARRPVKKKTAAGKKKTAK